MAIRKVLIVAAGLMTASGANAEDVPSNAELFRMLKAQQQTISELRNELKQARLERRAAGTSQPREIAAARQAGREAAKEAMAAAPPSQSYAMYPKGSFVSQSMGRGAYVGIFGGGGRRGSSSNSQLGTAFFTEAVGGPLAIDATGRTDSGGVGFGGAHIGYEWSYGSRLLPAFEIEGLYLKGSDQRATLQNPNLRLAEQTFENTYPTNTTAILTNMVVGFRTPYQNITPYIGGGIGAARSSISGAWSSQTNPVEAGINHFNGGASSSVWGFAAQAKAGVRVSLGDSGAYVFGEYRYLYLGAVDHVFGSTVDPTHAATSPWTARFGSTSYNLAAGGIGFSF